MVKRLVIVGDSFCADRKIATDWPVKLANMLGRQLRGEGRGGRAWWTTRSWIYKNIGQIDQDTILIVCHTSPSRLPNQNHYPISTGILHSEVSAPSNDLRLVDPNGELFNLAKNFYLSDLYVHEFYEWAGRCWLHEVNNLAQRVHKLIHLPGPDAIHHSFDTQYSNSIRIEPSLECKALVDLSMKELKQNGRKFFGPDARHNHLTEHNNIKLAEALYTIIKSESAPTNPMHFDNLNEWSFTNDDFKVRMDFENY